ncbi:MAG: hypothetical protein Q4C96_03625 [Planctomycetia bacterium]|nr:hypothetical protein [Planctomycetia bacterium]
MEITVPTQQKTNIPWLKSGIYIKFIDHDLPFLRQRVVLINDSHRVLSDVQNYSQKTTIKIRFSQILLMETCMVYGLSPVV